MRQYLSKAKMMTCRLLGSTTSPEDEEMGGLSKETSSLLQLLIPLSLQARLVVQEDDENDDWDKEEAKEEETEKWTSRQQKACWLIMRLPVFTS